MTYLLAGVLVCVILGVLSFGSVLKHLLSMLLSLEFLVLMIFLLIVLHFYILSEGTYVAIIFLIFSVCEGALGLTMLVSMARSFGGDYISSLSLAA
uniref:NADH dehydrogenase subunit 4L n=1 Tax=Anurida maritima TaxID=64695 RepID=UPI0022FD4957|nr:NADH dehydrogenase subunit 4L [Anurida maritima]WBK17675.1 NADH dehydrogenase subunit 4L [Anurida maritima]